MNNQQRIRGASTELMNQSSNFIPSPTPAEQVSEPPQEKAWRTDQPAWLTDQLKALNNLAIVVTFFAGFVLADLVAVNDLDLDRGFREAYIFCLAISSCILVCLSLSSIVSIMVLERVSSWLNGWPHQGSDDARTMNKLAPKDPWKGKEEDAGATAATWIWCHRPVAEKLRHWILPAILLYFTGIFIRIGAPFDEESIPGIVIMGVIYLGLLPITIRENYRLLAILS